MNHTPLNNDKYIEENELNKNRGGYMYIVNLVALLAVQVIMWILEVIFTTLHVLLAFTIALLFAGLGLILLIIVIPVGVAIWVYDKLDGKLKGRS